VGGCLKFTSRTVCTTDSHCGTWTAVRDDGFTLDLSYDDDTMPIAITAEGRISTAGKKDSIGGAGEVTVGRTSLNFGFTGRPLKIKKCRKLLRRWVIANPPPQVEQYDGCLRRSDFGPPAVSDYILPFPTGRRYHLSQTYCFLHSTHRNEMAYDFDIPLGGEIVAARSGEVIAVIDDRPNDSPWPDANYMEIRHQDATVASFIHLMQDSVPVAVGSIVEQEQVIARSSMSGTILPHLHFVVFQDDPNVEGQDVPVNFSNSEGPLDPRGGLIQGQEYKALRY
jgi:murein DD-endopeptidase MepM/ murein hydrolase activator NlpD